MIDAFLIGDSMRAICIVAVFKPFNVFFECNYGVIVCYVNEINFVLIWKMID